MIQDVNAGYFGRHVVEGAIPGLLRARARTPAGSSLRVAFADALRTQTGLTDVGDDPPT